jgi:hypothetical protein
MSCGSNVADVYRIRWLLVVIPRQEEAPMSDMRATRVHHAARRRGGMAGRGASAAAEDAARRATLACCREACRIMPPSAHYPQVKHRNRATLIHPRQYRESYSAMARPHRTQTRKDLGFAMMMLTKKAVPAIAAMLGVAVSTSWAVPALAGPRNRAPQCRAAPFLCSRGVISSGYVRAARC